MFNPLLNSGNPIKNNPEEEASTPYPSTLLRAVAISLFTPIFIVITFIAGIFFFNQIVSLFPLPNIQSTNQNVGTFYEDVKVQNKFPNANIRKQKAGSLVASENIAKLQIEQQLLRDEIKNLKESLITVNIIYFLAKCLR